MSTVRDDRIGRRWLTAVGAIAFALLLVRTAWMSDDAYITFRTVDNFLHGYGLRWNVLNRVQAYTHPLWMFVVAGGTALTGELYYTATFLSIALSIGAFILCGLGASSLPMEVLTISALGVSKSFVDFSTSGLENPLTHALLGTFFTTYWYPFRSEDRRVVALSSIAGLIMLNRGDAGLLVLPVVTVSIAKVGLRRAWPLVVAATLPLLAWEVFSVIYYGFPLPNTAYAKLMTGLPRIDLAHQGLVYLLDSAANDPVTLLVIAAAVVSPMIGQADRAVSCGIVLYLAYVIWIGGDFMSGRFLAAPFFCSLMRLGRQQLPRFSAEWAVAFGLVWLTGLSTPRPVVFSTASYGVDLAPADAVPPSQIADERRVYYPTTALLTARRGVSMPSHRWLKLGEEERKRGRHVVVTYAAGFIGYAAGPEVHVLDRWALGDALLARLPSEVPWRIGHFERHIPIGYEETIATGQNVLRDQGVAAYYDKLRIVIEGPIWRRERFRTIWKMNVGEYDHLIASYGHGANARASMGVPIRRPRLVVASPSIVTQKPRDNTLQTAYASRNRSCRAISPAQNSPPTSSQWAGRFQVAIGAQRRVVDF
jgi:arabinofuranosyltransferase